jgi:hypothetical protein
MKKVKAPPGAKRLIESLRNMGYECSTAIADLIDNSLAAGASEVHVEMFAQSGARPAGVVIADNGRGMDRDELYEAMRFGAFQEYSAEDLGKYGLGLKTASLSQCRNLTVSSKAKATRGTRPRRYFMRWDLDYVYRTDDWDLLAPSSDELKQWEVEALTHTVAEANGTVVLWQGLDEALPLLTAQDVQQREKFLAYLIREVGDHLRMVFHRFMEGSVTRQRKLSLYMCGQKLEPWDPFCRSESTRELEIINIPLGSRHGETTSTVTISPFILPREDEFSSPKAWKDASGPRNWNAQQGFYFYRNHRLLQAGGWSNLRAADEHTKLLRVAVHFTRDLDQSFSMNVTKMRARIPTEIRDQVRNALSKWAKDARERYDRRPAKRAKGAAGMEGRPPAQAQPAQPKRHADTAPPNVTVGPVSFARSNAPTHKLTVVDGAKPGQLKILVPQTHELAAVFDTNDGDDLLKLCVSAIGVLEAVYEQHMSRDRIPLESLKRALRKHL